MPFRSEAQRRYLFARHPDIAERWAREYGTPKGLPARIADGKAAARLKRSREERNG